MEVPTPSPANTGCQLYVPPSAVACGSRSPVEGTEERVGRPGAGEGAWAAELQEGSVGARHRGLGGFRDSWIQELGQSWALKAEQSSPGKEPPGAAEGECGCGTCQHLGPQRLVGLTERRGSGTRCPTAPSAPSPPAGQPLAGNRRWRGAGGRPPQGGLSSSGQDTRHFLTLGPDLRAGAGTEGAAFQLAFQLLLHNLSTSCPGCKFQPFPSRATSSLCRCLALS